MSKYPISYIQFLSHFHGDRDYFECHEILEEYWKATDAGNKKSIWVGFILLAVSNYHYRRKNFPGAIRTLEKAYSIFSHEHSHLTKLGIDHEALIKVLSTRENRLKQNAPYTSFNLPISDPVLISLCQEECKENGFKWCSNSDPNNLELIHRHASRDRSDVILDRKMALEERQKERRQ